MFLGEIFRGIQVCFRSQGTKNTIRENLRLKVEIPGIWWFLEMWPTKWRLSDPFKGLSDLQLGDEKGTLNHLVFGVLRFKSGDSYLPFFFLEVWTLLSEQGRYSRWLLRTAGGGEMRSHFILFDDFETSDLACFIIPVEFVFCRFLLEFAPVSRGGWKKTFFERWQDKTHTFWSDTRDS